MKWPLVTVVCTVRNAEDTIAEALASLVYQTFESWNVIVVDDGSSDGTRKIVESVQATEPRLELLATGGVGRGRALNLGVGAASGDFVSILDADDVYHRRRLEVQVECYSSDVGDAFAVLGTEMALFRRLPELEWPEVPDWEVREVTKCIAFRNPIGHSSVLMRRSVLDAIGGYNETLGSQFDYDLWVRLVGNDYRLGFIERALTGKRIHKDQSFEGGDRLDYLMASGSVQLRAISETDAGWIAYVTMCARLMWGLISRSVRGVA